MKYRVITDHPVAVDSEDHLVPGGTMHDDSTNPAFNKKLCDLLSHIPKLRVMDLGCAGGGFVRSLVDDGHEAIGLEGSDYSLKWDGPGGTEQERATRKPGKRAQWATIPDRLFTCDITRPFTVVDESSPNVNPFGSDNYGGWFHAGDNLDYPIVPFDVVTAWEVMEHLPADRLPTLCHNVMAHMTPGGIWIMSVSLQRGMYHQTVQAPAWWLDLFSKSGLVNQPDMVRHFGRDWVRGPDQKAPESFHLILKRAA
jgi:hypothetical protein